MVVRAAIINSFVAHNFPLMVIGFLDLINFELSPRSTGLVQNGDKVADHLIQDSPHIDRGHYKHQGDCITNTVKNLLQAHYKRRGKEPDTPHKSCLIVPAWPGRQLEILQRRPLMFLTIVVVFNTIYQCFDIVELELV